MSEPVIIIFGLGRIGATGPDDIDVREIDTMLTERIAKTKDRYGRLDARAFAGDEFARERETARRVLATARSKGFLPLIRRTTDDNLAFWRSVFLAEGVEDRYLLLIDEPVAPAEINSARKRIAKRPRAAITIEALRRADPPELAGAEADLGMTFSSELRSYLATLPHDMTPTRFVRRIARHIWKLLPMSPTERGKLAARIFSTAPTLFQQSAHFRIWKEQQANVDENVILGAYETDREGYRAGALVISDTDDDALHWRGALAVHLHLFYPDMRADFFDALDCLPAPFDLFISTPESSDRAEIETYFRGLANVQAIIVEAVENRGRDIAPMIVAFGRRLMDFDLLLHVHSKKSPHSSSKNGWRQQLLQHLLHSRRHAAQVLNLFAGEPDLGLVFPIYHRSLLHEITWGENYETTRALISQVYASVNGAQNAKTELMPFPAGSFFIARGAALRPLFEIGIELEDFEPECGQLDGTLAHALERLLPFAADAAGFRSLQICAANRPQQSDR